METVRGQKHLSEAKKGTKELIYWKKCLIKVAQQPQKPPIGSKGVQTIHNRPFSCVCQHISRDSVEFNALTDLEVNTAVISFIFAKEREVPLLPFAACC